MRYCKGQLVLLQAEEGYRVGPYAGCEKTRWGNFHLVEVDRRTTISCTEAEMVQYAHPLPMNLTADKATMLRNLYG